jgi:hypothetical protein
MKNTVSRTIKDTWVNIGGVLKVTIVQVTIVFVVSNDKRTIKRTIKDTWMNVREMLKETMFITFLFVVDSDEFTNENTRVNVRKLLKETIFNILIPF